MIGYQDQLARLYFLQTRYSRAVQEWQDVLNQDPKFVGALKGIARSYEKLEAWGGALRYYRQALAANPNDRSVFQTIERIKNKYDTSGFSGPDPPTPNPTRSE